MSSTGASTVHDSQSEESSSDTESVVQQYERHFEEDVRVVPLEEALASCGVTLTSTPASSRMTPESLRRLCAQRQMYEHALELNQVLYFQQRGFGSIEHLDLFRNCVCLFLNNNCIQRIGAALAPLRSLKHLYLHCNTIEDLASADFSDNLELEFVNLSNNKITNLTCPSLTALPKLKTLLVANNLISDLQALVPVNGNLDAFDFSGNPIGPGISDEEILRLFRTHFSSLKQLYTNNVPAIAAMSQFRRRLILELPSLVFLDKTAITADERVLTAAWTRGGAEEETKLRTSLFDQKRQAMDDVLCNFRKFQAAGLEEHAVVRRVKEENLMTQQDAVSKLNAQLVQDIRRILSNSN